MLDGKVTLVTGAGQGIGRAIALEMALQGAAGVAVADRNHESVTETARLITGAGGQPLALDCDLRERDQIAAMFDRTMEAFGSLDVLANNAGVIETSLTSDCTIATLPEEVWDTVFEINLKAMWLATKFATPHLRRSTRGPSIVNTASVAGLIALRGAPAYGTSKAG